jgi:hypothetical protein
LQLLLSLAVILSEAKDRDALDWPSLPTLSNLTLIRSLFSPNQTKSRHLYDSGEEPSIPRIKIPHPVFNRKPLLNPPNPVFFL